MDSARTGTSPLGCFTQSSAVENRFDGRCREETISDLKASDAKVTGTVCPKCGFNQEQGSECLRCGIIFARVHSAGFSNTVPEIEIQRNIPPPKGFLRRAYRVFRWVSLAALVILLGLIVHPSAPPQVMVGPDAAIKADSKVQEFQSSVQLGQPESLELDESELNGWLSSNLALKRTNPVPAQAVARQESVISLAKKALAPEAAQVEQVQSSVRDVRVALGEDSLLAYTVFDAHGVDLSLELEGRLLVRNGFLCFEPTRGKLGSLPLLAGTLQKTADRLFNSPENKEKFRLPPQIRDVHVEHGRLIVSSF